MTDPLYDSPARTPTPAAEAFAAVERLALELGPALGPPAVRLLQAMLLHEGWVWNHNCGGCKARVGQRYTCLRTHEVVPDAVADRLTGKPQPGDTPEQARLRFERREADEQAFAHPHVAPGTRAVYFRTAKGEHSHPATRFASFPTFTAGAEAWLRKLLLGGSYDTPSLRAALAAGHPGLLADSLRAKGYFTSSARAYGEALAVRLAEVPEHRTPGDRLAEVIAAAVA